MTTIMRVQITTIVPGCSKRTAEKSFQTKPYVIAAACPDICEAATEFRARQIGPKVVFFSEILSKIFVIGFGYSDIFLGT